MSASTNQITTSGHSYDANGNAVVMPTKTGPCATGTQMCYGGDNRLTAVTVGSNTDTYAYAPDNKRVWKKKQEGSQEIYFYGLGGQRLGTYIPRVDAQYGLYIDAGATNVYFGGS